MTQRNAKSLQNNPTDAERKLWSYLRMHQVHGLKFRRQRSIGPYIVDFVCLEKRLVVEVDGGQHAQQAPYDASRDDYLASLVFKVLRFWNNAVLVETDAVVEAIAQALEHHEDPHPDLFPQAEKGVTLSNDEKTLNTLETPAPHA